MTRAYWLGAATALVKCQCKKDDGQAWSINGVIYWECHECSATWQAYVRTREYETSDGAKYSEVPHVG